MELTWWGTAGFCVTTGGHVFLIDPYLSRNSAARPLQPMGPDDVSGGEQIFLSHGHFDHASDVPAIASRAGAAVYCSSGVRDALVQKSLSQEKIHVVHSDGYTADFSGYQAQAFFSRHIRFDWLLLMRTIARMNIHFFRYLPWMRDYPGGQVLSWRFSIDGFVIHHFGSAGSPPEELDRLAGQPVDLLLVPLQGHTRICAIALKYVQALRPQLVIPHHQDDFFPPISSSVDVEPFVRGVKRECPDTEVHVMALNETVIL